MTQTLGSRRQGLKTVYVEKDPNSTLPYQWDWSLWLNTGDTILTSTWSVPTGLTLVNLTHDDTTASVQLSGGVLDANYAVVNHITTVAGYQEDAQFNFHISDEF